MFTRMLAGQADNTICYYNERVNYKIGSHASQLAKAVCLFSPFQFLYWYDKASPLPDKKDGLWSTTNYIGDEPELEFFDNDPTVNTRTHVMIDSIDVGRNTVYPAKLDSNKGIAMQIVPVYHPP